jgi:hypothetical protein
MSTDAQPTPRPTRSGLRVLAVGVLIRAIGLPVLYVASYGPAFRLLMLGRINPDSLGRIYAPLDWASERSDSFGLALNWYTNLWIDDL